MKLIEIAERTWALDREEIIKRKCPTDLGERYRKYENTQKPECDQPGACEYCWEQEEGCKYIKTCPSASGSCINQGPSPDCIDFLQNAYQRYADLGVTPEQIKEIDGLYQEKCKEVAELRRRLHGKEMEKEELPRNRDKTAQKPGRNRGKIKARRYRDNIQEDRRAGRKGGRNRNAVYIHQKVPTLPFAERYKRILRKFRNS